MATRRLPNYIRTNRKHARLSQSELSFLLRLKDKSELSRYERSVRQPSLRTALACQEVFGTPVSELFGGLNDSVARDTRGQMKRLHTRIQQQLTMKKRENIFIQKLQWISQRLLDMPKLVTEFSI
jgi:transcriptional regulator with XRE-family HTH domain